MLGLEQLNVLKVGLFLGLQVNLLQRSRSVASEKIASHLIPRRLRICTSQPCNFLKSANPRPSSDLKLLLPWYILVIHHSPLKDLFLRIALAMWGCVFSNTEGRSLGECLELLPWMHQ